VLGYFFAVFVPAVPKLHLKSTPKPNPQKSRIFILRVGK
jgi:hypothetical protein